MASYYIDTAAPSAQSEGTSAHTADRMKHSRHALARVTLSFIALVMFAAAVIFPVMERENTISDMRALGVNVNDTAAVQEYLLTSGNSPESPHAFCAGVGNGMNGGGSGGGSAGFLSNAPNPDATGRKFTIDEAYGTGTSFTSYYGEGEGGGWITLFPSDPTPEDRMDLVYSSPHVGVTENDMDNEALERMDNHRDMTACIWGGINAGIPTLIFTLGAQLFTNFAIMLSTFAFDTNFICADPANPSGICINLIGIIGGSGGTSEGIIGALTSSIYIPLSIIAAALAGFSVLWMGVVKRQYRKATFNLLWTLGAFIFGLALLLNPLLMARAPQVVSNSVVACVVAAFNGENCFSGRSAGNTDMFSADSDSGPSGARDSRQECLSEASGLSPDEQMGMVINGLGCNIYKAFVLGGWSQAQFGMGYDQLSMNTESTRQMVEDAGLSPSDFCINMRSSNTWADMRDGNSDWVMNNSSNRVCNVAAYHMALSSATESSSDYTQRHSFDERWYNVIIFAASDDEVWANWATGGMHRIAMALFTGFTALLGSFIIITVSLFALVYYLGAIILMAFAPLFLLIALHPERGRKIFFGWLEKLVSNVLKYIGSALFLIVTLAFYSAVLQSADNIGTAFLFVLILTMALWMYRKEIIDLLGRVNMGGEQMSSSAMDKMKGRFNIEDPNSALRRGGAALVGGAIGNRAAQGGARGIREAMAERKARGEGSRIGAVAKGMGRNLKHDVTTGLGGAAGAATREAKRDRGVLGAIARQGDRGSSDRDRKRRDQEKAVVDRNEREQQTASRKAARSADILDSDINAVEAQANRASAPRVLRDSYGQEREMSNSEAYQMLNGKKHDDNNIKADAYNQTAQGLSEAEAQALHHQVSIEGLDDSINDMKTLQNRPGISDAEVDQLAQAIVAAEQQKEALQVELTGLNIGDDALNKNWGDFNDAYSHTAGRYGYDRLVEATDYNGDRVKRIMPEDEKKELAEATGQFKDAAQGGPEVDAAQDRIAAHIGNVKNATAKEEAASKYNELVDKWKNDNGLDTPLPAGVREQFRDDALKHGRAEGLEIERGLRDKYAQYLKTEHGGGEKFNNAMHDMPNIDPRAAAAGAGAAGAAGAAAGAGQDTSPDIAGAADRDTRPVDEYKHQLEDPMVDPESGEEAPAFEDPNPEGRTVTDEYGSGAADPTVDPQTGEAAPAPFDDPTPEGGAGGAMPDIPGAGGQDAGAGEAAGSGEGDAMPEIPDDSYPMGGIDAGREESYRHDVSDAQMPDVPPDAYDDEAAPMPDPGPQAPSEDTSAQMPPVDTTSQMPSDAPGRRPDSMPDLEDTQREPEPRTPPQDRGQDRGAPAAPPQTPEQPAPQQDTPREPEQKPQQDTPREPEQKPQQDTPRPEQSAQQSAPRPEPTSRESEMPPLESDSGPVRRGGNSDGSSGRSNRQARHKVNDKRPAADKNVKPISPVEEERRRMADQAGRAENMSRDEAEAQWQRQMNEYNRGPGDNRGPDNRGPEGRGGDGRGRGRGGPQ